ncbi:MAG: magnesium chelatase, partial [Bacteroidia bacterium]
LCKVKGLKEIVKATLGKLNKADELLMMEFVLHGLSEFSQLSKHQLNSGFEFKDLMSSMFDMKAGRAEEEEY